jgi:NAD(P)-dependent dehydrogenase (short-subunit alcohol dehydrogenase family)
VGKKSQQKTEWPVALVTGGNRGIGLAVCKELARKGCRVILAGRDEAKVREAVKSLKKSDQKVTGLRLDVADDFSVIAAEKFVAREFGRLDILVNNAGLFLDSGSNKTVETAKIDVVRATFEVNFYGPLRMIQAFLPGMKERNFGRIVNVSSSMGQLTDSRPHYVGYRTSKTALNSLTRMVATDTVDHNIACNSVCPGWVRTDMGGPEAERTPKKGAETIVWLALQKEKDPTGKYFKDKAEMPW